MKKPKKSKKKSTGRTRGVRPAVHVDGSRAQTPTELAQRVRRTKERHKHPLRPAMRPAPVQRRFESELSCPGLERALCIFLVKTNTGIC
jgi:hypothetical protein